MTRRARVVAALGALLGAACSGTETGNPRAEAELALGATTHDAGLAAFRADGPVAPGAVGVDSVLVSWGASELLSCGDGPSVGFEPAIADLVEPPPPAVEPRAERESCAYQGRLSPAAADASPEEIAGYSIVVRGARGDSTPFTIRSVAVHEFQLLPVAPVQNFLPDSLLLAFDIATWFERVDLDAAELAPGATEIVVGVDDNPALLADFEAALLPGLALYADQNDNGRVDPAEADPIASAP